MILKVCGITDRCKGIEEIPATHLGFIFHRPSPRNAFSTAPEFIRRLGRKYATTGVFVDSDLDEIERICRERDIRTVQLHGSESPEFCRQLKSQGYTVIKAVRVMPATTKEDLVRLSGDYRDKADYLLFDTGGKLPGGNGMKFNWQLLETPLEMPYILSGGIGPEDSEEVGGMLMRPPLRFEGLDINSRFEVSPGEKDIKLINEFINKIHEQRPQPA